MFSSDFRISEFLQAAVKPSEPKMPSQVASRVSHRPPTVIETAATEKEARRVLAWQHEVAKSVSSQNDSEDGSETGSQYSTSTYRTQAREANPAPRSHAPSQSHAPSHAPSYVPSYVPSQAPSQRESRAPPRRHASYPEPSEAPTQQQMRLVRRVTETTHSFEPTREETGMSSKAIIGTLLGAAAGAAVAYAMVRSEEPESMENAPNPHLAYGTSYEPYGVHAPSVRIVDRIEMEPAQTFVSMREREPRYVPAYSVARDSRPPISGRSDMHRIADGRDASVVSSNYSGSQRTRSRTRSDAGDKLRPLSILPPPAGSQAGTHVSRRSSKTDGLPATAATHVSKAPSAAKSYVSTSTVKPATAVMYGSGPVPTAPASAAGTKVSTTKSKAASKAGSSHPHESKSHVTTTTIKVLPNAAERREEWAKTSSKVSDRSSKTNKTVRDARAVPVPKSVVSGLGYEESVAPCDSVSNVGGRRGGW